MRIKKIVKNFMAISENCCMFKFEKLNDDFCHNMPPFYTKSGELVCVY